MDKEFKISVDQFMEMFIKLSPDDQDDVYRYLEQEIKKKEAAQHG